MKEQFKFRYVNEITGTFVLVIIALLIAIVVWTGHSQSWFRSNVTLRIILPEAGAAGIRQGSEVYFLGTRVGSVSDVIVDAAGNMEAQTSIRRDFFRFVRADSSAVVNRKFDVVGDSYFEITRGHGQPLPEKNASIVCNEQLPGALENAVEEIRREAVPALQKLSVGLDTWTMLGSNLITTREQLDQLIVRGNNIADDLQQGKGTAGKLLIDPSAADEMQALLVQAHRSMDNLQLTLTNLQDASANLQMASTNLPAISDALGAGANDLPGLMSQTLASMRELERLTEAMQHQWLWRKYVNPTNPPPQQPLPAKVSVSISP